MAYSARPGFSAAGQDEGQGTLAAGGDSAGGNAVTQRGGIFLGRAGRAGFAPGRSLGSRSWRSAAARERARPARRGRRALGGRGVSRALRESAAFPRAAAAAARRARRARTACSSRRRPPRRRAVATFPAGRAGPGRAGRWRRGPRAGSSASSSSGTASGATGASDASEGTSEGASAETSEGVRAWCRGRRHDLVDGLGGVRGGQRLPRRGRAVAAATEARPAAAAPRPAPSGEAQTGARLRGVRA